MLAVLRVFTLLTRLEHVLRNTAITEASGRTSVRLPRVDRLFDPLTVSLVPGRCAKIPLALINSIESIQHWFTRVFFYLLDVQSDSHEPSNITTMPHFEYIPKDRIWKAVWYHLPIIWHHNCIS